MTPGSVFFHEQFVFHDGASGEKLFVVLGSEGNVAVVAKTTSRQRGKGTIFGCQPTDRLHNFYIPQSITYLNKCTWVCLDELYEIDLRKALQLRMQAIIKPVCTFEGEIIREIQNCALLGEDITPFQTGAITSCLV